MGKQREIIKQAVLIDRFNEFVRLAKEYLGVDIAPLNERGCCFALAQYNIKFARVNALNDFYDHIGYITAHFTKEGAMALLQKAKIKRTPEQERALLVGDKSVQQPTAIFNDFDLPNSTHKFEELMDFVTGISLAQVGYESLMAKGRFAKKTGQFSLGRFENIAGNWENSFTTFGNRRALTKALKKMQISEHHYTMIVSGNHAICLRKTANNRYIIYDSNDSGRPKSVKHLFSVANKIVYCFLRVGCVTRRGEVAITMDTVSFGQGDLELKRSLDHYRSLGDVKPTHSLALQCHNIIMEADSLMGAAFNLYSLYTQHKEDGLVQSIQAFIKPLPPALQQAVTSGFHYVKQAAFEDSVEKKTKITYTEEGMRDETKVFMRQINEMIAQYHDGHLSRADFAQNALNRINQMLGSQDVEALQRLKVFGDIMKLKLDMETYLDGTVTGMNLIHSMPTIDLNQRDDSGFGLINLLFENSPNKAAIQAAFERGERHGPFQYNPENNVDRSTLQQLLVQASSDTVAYLATKMDLLAAITFPHPVGYELVLMSTLPDNKPERAEKGKIYLSEKGDYCVYDAKGKLQQGSLKEQPLSFKNLEKKLEDIAFQAAVLGAVAKKGHIATYTLFQKVIESGNTEVVHYLSKAFSGIDLKQTVPLVGSNKKTSQKNLVDVAVINSDEALVLSLLEKGTPLSPESASNILEKANVRTLMMQYQKMIDAQKSQFEVTNEKRPPTIRGQVQSRWGGVLAKIKAKVEEKNLIHYTYAMFQAEHKEDFQRVAAWQKVVEHILASNDTSNLDILFKAALRTKNTAVAERLLQKIQPSTPELTHELSDRRLKLLNMVILKGDLLAVKRLIEQDATLANGAYTDGSTVTAKSLLALACENKHSGIAKYLIQAKADVNKGVPSPLYYAARTGDLDLVKLLIRQGAKPDVTSQVHSKTPLTGIMEAPLSADEKKELYNAMYKDINTAEFDPITVKNAIIEAAKLPNTTEEDIEILTDKFNVDLATIFSEKGDSLAMLSLKEGNNFGLTQYFIKKTGQGPHYKNKQGESLLSIMIDKIKGQEFEQSRQSERYKPEFMAQLLKQFNEWIENDSSLVNEHFGDGRSPLMRAVGSVTLMKILIDNTAGINDQNKLDGQTALHYAANTRNREVINLLLKKKPDLLIQDKQCNTPMHILAAQKPTLEELIAIKGVDQELHEPGAKGNTVLHIAVQGGDKNRDLIEALLQAGLNPFQPNQADPPQSALDIARSSGGKNISALIQICENLSPEDMIEHNELLVQLEPYRVEMAALFKRELGAVDLENPVAIKKAEERINLFCNQQNGFGLLCKQWIQQDKLKQGRLSAHTTGNDLFTEIKKIKENYLQQAQAKPIKAERINPNKFRNL